MKYSLHYSIKRENERLQGHLAIDCEVTLMERGYWVNVATETGMAKNTFYRRKRKGMSDKQAATTPLSNRGRPTGSVKEYAVYRGEDRKSTRLNSSHVAISYAVFCLKK